jgi:hypothetical protein
MATFLVCFHPRALRVEAFFVLVLLTQVEEVRLERSVEDLSEQLNASKLALKYAERGDFTYLSKLVPGGQVRRSPTFDLPERASKLRCSPERVLALRVIILGRLLVCVTSRGRVSSRP